MREISLEIDYNKLPVETCLVYGDTGSGKTTFTAGWPRPLFLADESEGGWRSLRGLSDDQLFEPDRDPIVWGIEKMNDVAQALERIPPLIAAGRVMTIGFSSITFYANTYLTHLTGNAPDQDKRQLYGDLATHLRSVRTRFHNLGVNVVWEALAAHPQTVDGKVLKGRPAIAGQAADQFAAGVTYLFRSTMDDVRDGGAIVDRILNLHTQDSGGYLCRGRMGVGGPQLPNPLKGGYKGMLRALGYDVERMRQSLPQAKTTIPVTASTTKPKATVSPAGK